MAVMVVMAVMGVMAVVAAVVMVLVVAVMAEHARAVPCLQALVARPCPQAFYQTTPGPSSETASLELSTPPQELSSPSQELSTLPQAPSPPGPRTCFYFPGAYTDTPSRMLLAP